MFEPPVELLSGGKDSRTRRPKRIEGDNVGIMDRRHCQKVVVRGRGRRVGVGKELTAG